MAGVVNLQNCARSPIFYTTIANAINSYFTSIASSLLANSNEIESEFAPGEAPLNIEPFKFTIRNVNEVSKAIEDLNQAKSHRT